jgi:hypothetical protein
MHVIVQAKDRNKKLRKKEVKVPNEIDQNVSHLAVLIGSNRSNTNNDTPMDVIVQRYLGFFYFLENG